RARRGNCARRSGPDRGRGMVCSALRRDAGHSSWHKGRCAPDRGRVRPRVPEGVAMIADAVIIVLVVIGFLMVVTAMRTIRIVPQARARNVERFGRYTKTMEPGMNFIIPFIDRVKPLIDLREQVVSFTGQRVITEDNLVVSIDTVLFFQVTDPRAA